MYIKIGAGILKIWSPYASPAPVSAWTPTIPSGAIVTIDTSICIPEPLLGKVVAIYKKDDGATIKRLGRTDHGWCGIPDNRDPQYAIITINHGDRIIGKINSVHYAL